MAEPADKVTSITAKERPGKAPEPESALDRTPERKPANTVEASPATAARSPAARRPKSRRGLGLLVSLIVLAIAGYFGFREFQARLTHVFEQDARIAGDLITVSSRVSGWVTSVEVKESQTVSKGDILVSIDDRESDLAAQRLRAQRDGIVAEQERLRAERKLAADQIRSRINTRISEVHAARSANDSLRPQVRLARSEFRRAESLFRKKVIPKRELDRARTTMQRLEGNLQTASADLESSEAKLREARADQARMKVFDGKIAVLDHKRLEVETQLNAQMLDLVDRTIRAPVDSVIDRTFVEAGEYVTPGQRLVLVHDPKQVWVEANIKETEIRRLKVGQPTDIHVDAYPDRRFTGKVLSIGNAATSEFALLPSPNPSGNFTKTTQRLRALIAVDQTDGLLRPGMMVEVSIDVR